MDSLELLRLNEEAVKLREAGKLEEANTIFSEIHLELPLLAKSSKKEDRDSYVGLMGEQIILQRHLSGASAVNAHKEALLLYKWAKENKIKAPYLGFAIRGVSNTLMDMGEFEQAESYLREMIKNLDPQNSAFIGDTEAHLAKCLFRQGNVKEASRLVEFALGKLIQNVGRSDPMRLAVWHSHALMVKALIYKSNKKMTKARAVLNEALLIAESQNIAIRTKQIKSLLQLLEK